MNSKKMYFFSPDIESYKVIFLMIRMIGCLLIGQRILAISADNDNENNQVRIYLHRK